MIFDQNHEQISLFMVLFKNEDNVPVLSTQWNSGSNGFLATFSHFSLWLTGGPTFCVPPNARPTEAEWKKGVYVSLSLLCTTYQENQKNNNFMESKNKSLKCRVLLDFG